MKRKHSYPQVSSFPVYVQQVFIPPLQSCFTSSAGSVSQICQDPAAQPSIQSVQKNYLVLWLQKSKTYQYEYTFQLPAFLCVVWFVFRVRTSFLTWNLILKTNFIKGSSRSYLVIYFRGGVLEYSQSDGSGLKCARFSGLIHDHVCVFVFICAFSKRARKDLWRQRGGK